MKYNPNVPGNRKNWTPDQQTKLGSKELRQAMGVKEPEPKPPTPVEVVASE